MTILKDFWRKVKVKNSLLFIPEMLPYKVWCGWGCSSVSNMLVYHAWNHLITPLCELRVVVLPIFGRWEHEGQQLNVPCILSLSVYTLSKRPSSGHRPEFRSHWCRLLLSLGHVKTNKAGLWEDPRYCQCIHACAGWLLISLLRELRSIQRSQMNTRGIIYY